MVFTPPLCAASGSHLYLPTVQLDDVILPATQKDLVISSVKASRTATSTSTPPTLA